MRITQVLFYVASLGSLPFSAPHEGMIDSLEFRDVGVVFKANDYQGKSKFLLMDKANNENQCMILNAAPAPNYEALGFSIGSLQICWPTPCVLFTGDNCTESAGENFSLTVLGPYDAPNVQIPGGTISIFKSYTCGGEQRVSSRM